MGSGLTFGQCLNVRRDRDTPTSRDGPLSHRGESPRRFCSRGQCDSGDLWVSRTRPPELAELGPSAEAWTVDFVLHRTRQESTTSGSLDVCLIYRRGRVDLETCGSESVSWLLQVDLNHRPQHYEGRSSTLTYCFN